MTRTLIRLTMDELLLSHRIAERACEDTRNTAHHNRAVDAYRRARTIRAEICNRVSVSLEVQS